MNRSFNPHCSFQVIELTSGDHAFVDTVDFELVRYYSWNLTSKGYARTLRATLPMHRLILGLGPKEGEDNVDVHHINENKLDNRKVNLKILGESDHRLTRSKQKNNKSGFKGVSIHKFTGRWQAQCAGRYLGLYDTPEAAASAYDTHAKEIYGDIAQLNFPTC